MKRRHEIGREKEVLPGIENWSKYSLKFFLTWIYFNAKEGDGASALWSGCWGHWGNESLTNLPKVTPLVRHSTGIQTEPAYPCIPQYVIDKGFIE